MQHYVGVKLIQAAPAQKDGEEGYNVLYPDGYASWSPKEQFENEYFPITSPNSIQEDDVTRFIAQATFSDIDPKTTLVKIDCITGFVQYDTASCVDPKNYDREIGGSIALSYIKTRLWEYLGFVVQWANQGLKDTPKLIKVQEPPKMEGATNA